MQENITDLYAEIIGNNKSIYNLKTTKQISEKITEIIINNEKFAQIIE